MPVSVVSGTNNPNCRPNKSLLTSLHAPKVGKILKKIFDKMKILDANYKISTVC